MRTFSTFFLFIALGIFACCVSETLPEQRYRDSKLVSAPTMVLPGFNSSQFSFGVVSDLHVGGANTDRLQRIIQKAQTNGDSFLVFPGDLADDGLEADFLAIQSTMNASAFNQKYLPVIGNHDIFKSGWTYFKTIFGASHYVYSNGNVKFIVLDTADGTLGEDQFNWLENELKTNTFPVTFLVSHYLPIVPGREITDQNWLKLSNETECQRLMGMAKRYGVKAWLGGHYHSYIARNIEGVDYVVTGGGGGRRMAPVKKFFYVRVLVQGSTLNYQMIEVD